MTKQLAIDNPALIKIFSHEPPLGRMGEKSDLAGAVVYLLSEAAGYTTGVDIPITGGLHAGRIDSRYQAHTV